MYVEVLRIVQVMAALATTAPSDDLQRALSHDNSRICATRAEPRLEIVERAKNIIGASRRPPPETLAQRALICLDVPATEYERKLTHNIFVCGDERHGRLALRARADPCRALSLE